MNIKKRKSLMATMVVITMLAVLAAGVYASEDNDVDAIEISSTAYTFSGVSLDTSTNTITGNVTPISGSVGSNTKLLVTFNYLEGSVNRSISSQFAVSDLGSSGTFNVSAASSGTLQSVTLRVFDGASFILGTTSTYGYYFHSAVGQTVYNIVATVTNGTMTPAGYNSVVSGNSITFTYAGDTGATLQSLIINGSSVDITAYPTSYTFNGSANGTISAVFGNDTGSVTFDTDSPQTYTGLEITPTITNALVEGNPAGTEGIDYSVLYSVASGQTGTLGPNLKPLTAGTYTVTVTMLTGPYIGSSASEVYTVSPAELIVTVDETKTYDGTVFQYTLAGTDVSGLVVGDSLTAGALTTTGSVVDIYTVETTDWTVTTAIATTNGISNYNVIFSSVSLEITALQLTVTGITAETRAYSEGVTSVTLNSTGYVLVGIISGDTVTLDGSSAIGNMSDDSVGTDKPVIVSGYTLGGADAGNYTLVQPTDVTVDITA